jgi:hypothetical protein
MTGNRPSRCGTKIRDWWGDAGKSYRLPLRRRVHDAAFDTSTASKMALAAALASVSEPARRRLARALFRATTV